MDSPAQYAPDPQRPRGVLTESGERLAVPDDWDLLAPGDAAATRRVKKAGPHWVVSEQRGRRRFGRGVWAPRTTIAGVLKDLESERRDPAYAAGLEKARQRRDKKQAAYVDTFKGAVFDFLDFAPRYMDLAATLASAIATHATPVGSGTVARTERIPVDKRAEAATIAWMRHQTTAYDSLKIARVKGRRREVRRQLAERSKDLLGAYRRGDEIHLGRCPLARAIAQQPESSEASAP